MSSLTKIKYLCHKNENGNVPFVIITILLLQDSRLTTRYMTDVTWQVPAVQQEMHILPEHLCSTAMLGGQMRCVWATTDVKLRKYLRKKWFK
jgi:hypothetical protein